MASVPVASIWWIGLKRPPNSPFCGPLASSGMPSANTLPVRIRLAALTMSCGVTWLSVPTWSSLPQRPQFLSFSVASAIAFLPTLMSIGVLPFPLLFIPVAVRGPPEGARQFGINALHRARNICALATSLPPLRWPLHCRSRKTGSYDMKLLSFTADGKEWFGAVSGDGLVTLNDRVGHANLRAALAAGAMDAMRKAAKDAKPDRKLDDVKFLPVIPHPEKILCAGVNYRAHASEVGRELPKQPSMFIRFTDTLVGHDGEMIRPNVSDHFDFEGELTLVIGTGGRHIKAEHALGHVAGYTCFVDGSVRDYQRFSVTSGKNFPGTGPLGPWLVTADEIPDPSELTLTTRLNGQQGQHSDTYKLIYSIPQIVAFCSDCTALSAGDIIATGTPEGVGHSRKPPLWMKPGDTLEVEITGIGTLRARIIDEMK